MPKDLYAVVAGSRVRTFKSETAAIQYANSVLNRTDDDDDDEDSDGMPAVAIYKKVARVIKQAAPALVEFLQDNGTVIRALKGK